MDVSTLNSAQQEAVMFNDGPSLVIAGAGSGKTRVLTYKVAYLIHLGLEPGRILALTFTNKAAREMKDRIAKMVDSEKARWLNMGTFHSIFSKILRADSASIGLHPDYSVYDTDDSKKLIHDIVKSMNLDDKVYKSGLVLGRISHAKNNIVTAHDYAASNAVKEDYLAGLPQIKDIYLQYEERCRRANAVDFDDMLLLTYQLFKQHPEVLEKYQHRFQYILVDEYQDTNFLQAQIVRMLAEKHHRVCVVGDDAQSIYSFRGANIGNILQFRKIYPEAKLFKLERNYRSTQSIVNVANSLIAKNRNQIPKQVYSERDAGELVSVYETDSDRSEAELVASKLKQMNKRGVPYSEMAVLYRNNNQSRQIEDAFRSQNIPYCIHGGTSFYQRKEIKNVLAYLRLIQNTADEEAFLRIVNYPARGIGDTTVGKISDKAQAHGQDLFEVAANPVKYQLEVNSGAQKKIAAFVDLITSLKQVCEEMNVYDFVKEVVRRSGIEQSLNDLDKEERESTLQNIDELLTMVHEFEQRKQEEGQERVGLTDFLIEAALITDADQDEEDGVDRVTLMTIHAAKGLEFDVVAIVGVETDLIPSYMSVNSLAEIEEERRLLYVAITRAKESCMLSWAKQRFRNGKPCFPSISPFVKNDIDRSLLSFNVGGGTHYGSPFDFSRQDRGFFSRQTTTTPKVTPRPSVSLPSNAKLVKVSRVSSAGTPVQNAGWEPGMRVHHDTFGDGEIIEVDRQSASPRIKVNFDLAGPKTLLLQFAKIKRL
ncbi:MAG: UvrD-helicase domain-containing protein [Paludibacteraceae bacterium]|nr:UvrD-helicase domain-containing protein [Paludibacteraceae bacterium]